MKKKMIPVEEDCSDDLFVVSFVVDSFLSGGRVVFCCADDVERVCF